MSDAPNLDKRIEVRFQGFCVGCFNLVLLPLFYFLLLLPWEVAFILLLPVGAALAYSLFFLLASFDRRPLMIVAPEGVYLPVAGNVLLPYESIEVWAERAQARDGDAWYDLFALQGLPSVYLDIGWWAWLRRVRANTLLQGDLCFDERFIDASASSLAAAIQARIDRAAAAG